MALGCRPPAPLQRLHRILGDAMALSVRDGQMVLSPVAALLCGQAEPTHRFHMVLGNTAPECITQTNIALGLGVSLCRRLAIPFQRQIKILSYALTLLIADADPVLSR